MILSNSLQRDFCGDLNEFGLSDAELSPSIYPSARVIFHPNRYCHNTSYVILTTFEVGLLSFDHFTSVKCTVYPKLRRNFAMCQSEKINTTKTFAQTLVPMWWKLFLVDLQNPVFPLWVMLIEHFTCSFFCKCLAIFHFSGFFSLLLTLPVYLSCCHRP